MTTTPRIVRAAVAGLLALLSGCALTGGLPSGGGTDPDRITLGEITASGAPDGYEVVQRLRPTWLRQRIDHRSTGRDLETLVIHNGARIGYLGSLRDLPAEMIGSMRFMHGSEAQSLLTSNDKEIGAIIQVFSRGVAAHDERRAVEGVGGTLQGVSISVFPLGYATQARASAARDAMLANGWTVTKDVRGSSGSMMAAADIGVARSLTVGVVAARRMGTDEEAYARGGGSGGVAFSHTSSTMGAVVGYRVGPLRIGAGPVLQVSTVTRAIGECGCQARKRETYYTQGGLVEGVAQLRVLRVLTGELRVQRYFMAEPSVRVFSHTPRYELSHTGWFVGLGAGFRLGR